MKNIAGLIGALLVGFPLPAPVAGATQQRDLSEFFVLEQVRGKRQDLFVRAPDGTLQYIGTTADPAPPKGLGDLGEGLGETVLAISSDGRSVAFVHRPDLAKKRPKKEGGLYVYTYGSGGTLRYPLAALRRSWTRWSKPVPPDVIFFALAGGSDADWRGLTADGEELPLPLLGGSELHRVAYEGRADQVEALLERGLDVEARTYWGLTPLQIAIVRGQDAVARALLDRGADVVLEGYHAFHLAIAYKRIDLLAPILHTGVDINAPNVLGSIPLHIAVDPRPHLAVPDAYTLYGWGRSGASSRQLIEWLLDHGADPNARAQDGRTAVHVLAATKPLVEPIEAMRILLERRADAAARDEQGNTPLHYAAAGGLRDERHGPAWEQSGYPELLGLLVSHSPEIDARNTDGLTPLQLAVGMRYVRTAQFLVARGADDSVRGSDGRTLKEAIEKTIRSEWWKFVNRD